MSHEDCQVHDNALIQQSHACSSTSLFTFILKVIHKEIGHLEYNLSRAITNTPFQRAIEHIRDAYNEENQRTDAATNVKYSLSTFRSAYLYAFATSHSNMICKEWKHFAHHIPVPLIQKDAWHVCCVGGGPATDAIGLHLFLKERDVSPRSMDVAILDKWPEWRTTAKRLLRKLNKLNPRCKFSKLKYQQFDFFTDNAQEYESLKVADVVTMVKFLSVVCQNELTCRIKLKEILDATKPNALFLFVDNGGGPYNAIFKSVATIAGFRLRSEHSKHKVRISSPEEENVNKFRLAGNYRHQTQKEATIVSSLWIKSEADVND